MKVFNVDLYKYFGVKKPEGAKGILSGYILDSSKEIDINRKFPAMLVIPGGAYAIVSFREAEPVCMKYLAEGFCAFWLDYSVNPIHHPYQIIEAAMAMAYLRKNAEELKIDENKISAVGFSAGGHLCAMLGSVYQVEEWKTVFNTDINVQPNAIVLSYPVITSSEKGHKGSFINLCGDDEKLMQKLSIENLVSKDSAPAFIWATYNDQIVPVKNSLIVADAYENAGVKFSLHIFGKGVHGLSTADDTVFGTDYYKPLMTKNVIQWVDFSIEWLNEIYNG